MATRKPATKGGPSNAVARIKTKSGQYIYVIAKAGESPDDAIKRVSRAHPGDTSVERNW